MKTEMKRWSKLTYFFDSYGDIMYITLIIFAALILSAISPEKQVAYLVILGVHILSLYIPYLIYEASLKIEMHIRKKLPKCPIGEMIIDKMPTIMRATNIILIISAFILKIGIPIILAVIATMIISWLIYSLVEMLPLEEGVMIAFPDDAIGDIEMKISDKVLENPKMIKLLRAIFTIIPFAIIIIALTFIGWSILAKVLFFILYIITVIIIQYLGENVIDLETLFEIML